MSLVTIQEGEEFYFEKKNGKLYMGRIGRFGYYTLKRYKEE